MKHGVSAVIYKTNDQGVREYLLIQSHTQRGEHTGKYYFCGGWIDEGEKDDEAVVRECREELGLTVEAVRKIVAHEGDIPDLMLHFWECKILSGEIHMDTSELKDFGWFDAEKIKTLRVYPATLKVLKEYLQENV